MPGKTAKTSRKQSQRKIKIGKLPKSQRQLSAEELAAVEGGNSLTDFAGSVAQGVKDSVTGMVNTASSVASQVAKSVEQAIKK